MKREAQGGEHQGYRLLRYATILYAIGLVLHSADHVRRGIDASTPEVIWLGNITTVIGLIVIALVFSGHPLAPLGADDKGFGSAVGDTAVHLHPHWSAISDSFPDGGVGVTSWAVVLIEIAGLLALGAAGTHLLMNRWRRSGLAPGTASLGASSGHVRKAS
jgi:hypothetical protein